MNSLTYGSVCSGIEAATVAWHPLGWRPAWFAEIDKFPSAVLAHHYPETPNLGDMMEITDEQLGRITDGLLVGGTPCQSFSVAGLRRGLDDPRGNLALGFLRLVDRARPKWVVWENVPGVLSSGGGRDFGAFLGGLGQLGYGWSYRVLDAQYVRVDGYGRAVPQRRRRVFVVGHLGDWRRAAAVLFERESLSGHPAPRRKAGAGVAALTANGVGTCGADDNQAQAGHIVMAAHGQASAEIVRDGSPSLMCNHEAPIVAHTLRGEGHDASEDGTGRGIPLVFDERNVTSPDNRSNPQPGGPSNTLHEVPPTIAFHGSQDPDVSGKVTHPLGLNGGREACVAIGVDIYNQALTGQTGHTMTVGQTGHTSIIRRLTPRECERLQGFPDDYTLVPYRGKDAADGPRYKALGNSMAINPMRWIGRRIQAVEAIGGAA